MQTGQKTNLLCHSVADNLFVGFVLQAQMGDLGEVELFGGSTLEDVQHILFYSYCLLF